MEDSGMESTNIKFTVLNDFRKFKKDTVINLSIPRLGALYLASKNGQGKSTLLRGLRYLKDSLREVNNKIFDGMVNMQQKTDGIDTATNLKIEGFDYDNVFCLDAITDDPSNFINAATAYSLYASGGLEMQRLSKGEKSIYMLDIFLKKMTKYCEENDSFDKKNLIILDEIDEGLDINLQLKFNKILRNISIMKNCDIIVVSHNPLCMLSPIEKGSFDIKIYDLDNNKETTIEDYFISNTGYSIEINKS